MVMKGKFYSPLGLKNSDTVVDARGWIEWANIEPEIKRINVNVSIAQEDDAHGYPEDRSGHATCGPYVRPAAGKPTRVDWRCDVSEDYGRDWYKGLSTGSADLVNADLTGANAGWFWHWSDNPRLG
jgi:hypothetical protein